MHKTNVVGDKGSPCLTPFLTCKNGLRKLMLFIILHLGLLYNTFIHLINKFPKPYCLSIAKIKGHRKESNALYKSTESTAPERSSLLA